MRSRDPDNTKSLNEPDNGVGQYSCGHGSIVIVQLRHALTELF